MEKHVENFVTLCVFQIIEKDQLLLKQSVFIGFLMKTVIIYLIK